jgi:hypothetical protein
MPTITITRQRTRPGLRMVEVHDLGAVLVLVRPHDPARKVLVIFDHGTPAPMVRNVARALLPAGERRHLSRFLTDRRKR